MEKYRNTLVAVVESIYTDFVNFLCTFGARRFIRQCVTSALETDFIGGHKIV